MLRKTLVVAIASVLAVSRSIIHTAKALDEAEKQGEPRQEEKQQPTVQAAEQAQQPDQQVAENKSRWTELWAEIKREARTKADSFKQTKWFRYLQNVMFWSTFLLLHLGIAWAWDKLFYLIF